MIVLIKRYLYYYSMKIAQIGRKARRSKRKKKRAKLSLTVIIHVTDELGRWL